MIVVDTHAWIWWTAEPGRLSSKVRAALSEDEIGVCAISCWEIAMLVSKGRLELDRDVLLWIRQALALPGVVPLALTPEICVRAAGFGSDFPGDPADRMIAATAMERRAPVATRDRRLRSIVGLPTIW